MRFTVRQATPGDADQIAETHMDSIHSLGAKFYSPEIVAIWGAPRDGERYRRGMEEGDPHFVAILEGQVLGFSVYHREEGKHRTGIYVRGGVARQGIGTALFKAAEAEALKNGAGEIHVDASLGAVRFYKENGFEEIGRGLHRFKNGSFMDCMLMKKELSLT